MPTIAVFYGLIVRMYYLDHNPPHFHVECGGQHALIRISDGAIIAGSLPRTAQRLAIEWCELRRGELEANWARAKSGIRLKAIGGPDAH